MFYEHNRDKKSGRKQIVVGLICNEQGCPVCVEVFSGNTKDESTVQDKVKQLQNFYGIERFTFVGDRGMLTQTNQEKLKDTDGLDMISALTHPQIFELIQDKVIEPELFDEHNIAKIADPKISGRRLFLCRNPQSAQREANTRESLMNSLQQLKNHFHICRRRNQAADLAENNTLPMILLIPKLLVKRENHRQRQGM